MIGDTPWFIEDENPQGCGWMDDRWNEDFDEEHGLFLVDQYPHGSMGRAAGEKMDTPMNHEEI